MKPPGITFIAGPNGAGKSTLTSGNLDFFSAFPLLDPDALVNAIQADNKSKSPLAAGREVLERINSNLKGKRTFAVETTLSGKVYLQTMLEARNLGFYVSIIYIGTADVNIHLERVAARVELKGHNIAEADIRRRYRRSLDNLPIAVKRCDLAIVFDNSRPISEEQAARTYQLVAIIENDQPRWFEPLPEWAKPLKTSFD